MNRPLFFSKLVLNLASPQVHDDIENRYGFHLAVVSGFPGRYLESNRVLWRLERNTQGTHLLVQSQKAPDWTALLMRSGYLASPPEMKQMVVPLAAGQDLRFRLEANPAVRLTAEKNKVAVLSTDSERLQWLEERLAQHGMELLDADIAASDVQRMLREKPGEPKMVITLSRCRFEGRLRIKDPAGAGQGIAQGIGRGKAFGLGLLSLAAAA